jgi:hypothetical protein
LAMLVTQLSHIAQVEFLPEQLPSGFMSAGG